MPQLSTVHIDRGLTNISLMYRNSTYVADAVFPVVPVEKRSDKYFTYNKEDFLSTTPVENGMSKAVRRPGTEAAEIDYGVGTKTFYAEEYALRGLVADAEVAYSDDPLQPDIDQTIQLTDRLLLDNEVAVATVAGDRNNYPAANKVTLTTGSTGTSWASYSSVNSNPFNDIKNAKIAVVGGVAREPNMFLLCVTSARTLGDHPAVKDLVKYTSVDALTMSGLPKVLRGLIVTEAHAQKNTAVEGATYSGANVWRDSSSVAMGLVYYKNPMPSKKAVTYGVTFEAPDDTTGVRGIAVRRYRDEKRKGTLIEASFMRDWKLIAVDGNSDSTAGYLISDTAA